MTFLTADPDSSSWELERQTIKLLMIGALKRQAGRHWFCSWQILCQRSQPRPNWLMVWYLLKAKIVSKGSTPSQQEQQHFGRWEEHVWMRDAPFRVTVDAYLFQTSPFSYCCFSICRPYVTHLRNGWSVTLCMQYRPSLCLRVKCNRQSQVWFCRIEDTAYMPW